MPHSGATAAASDSEASLPAGCWPWLALRPQPLHHLFAVDSSILSGSNLHFVLGLQILGDALPSKFRLV
uniref:Uncharacterized protein n=1 Tax=Oryza barthii TaxID=65489 RepID=A0A0D3GYE2_9ORYZ